MILTRKYTFQAARKLTKINPDHICANLHGHTFHITIKIEGPLNNKNDFVMDFFDIDKIFNDSIFKSLDHKCLNDIDGLDSPTTENLAIWICLDSGRSEDTTITEISIKKSVSGQN